MTDRTFAAIGTKCREISELLSGKTSLSQLDAEPAAGAAQRSVPDLGER